MRGFLCFLVAMALSLALIRAQQCRLLERLSRRRAWLEIDAQSDFSIHNVPFGVFSPVEEPLRPRVGTAIGEHVLDLSTLYEAGLLQGIDRLEENVFASSTLNRFMSLPRSVWRETRTRVIELLLAESDIENATLDEESVCVSSGERLLVANHGLRDDAALRARSLFARDAVSLHLPVEVKEYTDFYSSREHATNVGTMFRGIDNALQPNWLHLPVGYHGRASTVVLSGTPVRRPLGQLQKDPVNPREGSILSACRKLDFELEMGVFLGGAANALGEPISLADAEERIFGVVLLNDWSARDIQSWEYVPLGPFTSKNFASSISPWVVLLDALEPFRASSSAGPVQDPEPLPYLKDREYDRGSFDVNLSVSIQPANESASSVSVVARSNYRNQYWNMKQQLVHHSITGAIMRTGDLLGSGTISGTSEDSYGSMLELSWSGTREVELQNSQADPKATRRFLQDGDRVVLSGFAERDGVRVGFGTVEGVVLPALSPDYT